MKGKEKLLDNNRLKTVLTDLLKNEFNDSNKIIILDRILNDYTSTFPTEIVSCQLSSGSTIKLFCKYISKKENSLIDTRGDQNYESLIYQHVLNSMNVNSPRCYGTYFDLITEQNILFLSYLEDAVRFSKVPSSIIEATTWIANFHKKSQNILNWKKFIFLKKYNLNYYSEWADRTLRLATDKHKKEYPWLPNLCNNFKSNVHLLLEEPLSIIHGEYYPGNVLYSKGEIVPVDWESASIACGMIDLASLTEGWDNEIIEDCIQKYCDVINEKREIHKFKVRFKLAQIYWILRRFSYNKNWTNRKNPIWRIEQLYNIGKKLQFIH